ncbi:MAG: MerR family transcriptional regulator [Methanocalculus sp. MSAO_Arc1]|uniref:MerR family transcriptional regulator n=1 Tax=Methanocalculus TaxID=71151 RepID=UPI000FF1D0E4|nr:MULTISPECIES: GyrI-like domain-containing protein [unclassified Methanocalculus]MCP1662373.1 effector-binding domain-containing protein [Methanocalculus sp. AMF5]RQD81381.1 MAG: MerR family transcriptional regulator [Methanocalculus sp. MSAO_Arc1]
MTSERISIGTFSWITHLSQKALRIYDERGLLIPQIRDLATGYRYYAKEQIERGIHIRNLVSLGFTLEATWAILEAQGRGDSEAVKKMSLQRSEEIQSEVRRLQQGRQHLLRYASQPELNDMTLTDPVTKEIAPLRVITKRDTGIYEETIPRLIEELFRLVDSQNGVLAVGTLMIIYHDCEYRETDADIEVALPITGRTKLSTRTLDGGLYLTAIHQGSYQNLPEGWSYLLSYAEANQFTVPGPGREVYLNDPGNTPPESLLTEIQIPVREKG